MSGNATAMVALVLVCHSRPLALALRETLHRLYADKSPPIFVAAGAGADGAELGTDATAIMAAIEQAGAGGDGVLVLLDLGSAVLSAEMALDFLDESLRSRVMLCAAPLVEGAIAAAAQSGIGATLAEVRAEAEGALRQKQEHLGEAHSAKPPHLVTDANAPTGEMAALELRVENPAGLHARPAMRIAQAVAPFASAVEITNGRTGKIASARSLVAITCLDVRAGDTIHVTARGADAAAALHALETLSQQHFGDSSTRPAAPEDVDPPPAENLPSRPAPGGPGTRASFQGKPLSEGVAIGTLFFAARAAPNLAAPTARVQPPAELARLREALAAVRRQLEQSATALTARMGLENAGILEAQRMLSLDPSLVERAENFIVDGGLPAAHAWQETSRLAAEAYRQLAQPRLRERARDVEDLSLQVLRALGVGMSAGLMAPPQPGILAVPTLLPTEVAALDFRNVRGILAEAIGPTSHAAILLRAGGVPAVDAVNLSGLRESIGADSGALVAFDGGTGEIWPRPNKAKRDEIERRRRESAADAALDARAIHGPMHTRDGRRIELAANVASISAATAAAQGGAEAIGLLRTEFLFFDRTEAPTEDEQAATIRGIAAIMPAEAPVTIRTFDIGGDKPVPYLVVPPEQNPFLGMRGLRLALQHPDLFLIHLRAILRAGAGRRFRVIFPMVTECEEIRRARVMLGRAHEQLAAEGVPHAWPIDLGMMVEVPAAALNAQSFVGEIDFFSIGTNDLTQYTLAAERGHPQLVEFADALHPAVLRLVRRVAAVAERAGKWAAVCGEAAADPLAAGVFIGLGVQELSVGVAALGRLRRLIGASEFRAQKIKARRCLRAASSGEVRAILAAPAEP